MKIIKLVAVFVLIGCGGGEFAPSIKSASGNAGEAGESTSDGGEGGESTSGGSNSGGSESKAGSAGNVTGGNSSAGTGTAGDTTSGGSTAGVGGSVVAGAGGSSTAGSAGNGGSGGNMSGGSGGNTVGENLCHQSPGQPCSEATWKTTWTCPDTTEGPPVYLTEDPIHGHVRNCTESYFGAPSNTWCCSS